MVSPKIQDLDLDVTVHFIIDKMYGSNFQARVAGKTTDTLIWVSFSLFV